MNSTYNKAIAAFIGSAVSLLAVFGIHTGWLNDPTNQNIIATVLAMGIPALLTYIVPANKVIPAPVSPNVHVATAAAAAQDAAQAAQVASAAASAVAASVTLGAQR